ncbi:MAG TPA: isoprenyl transferase [Candidatus Nanopelagicaceae bacterium]|nr:isoprenyl transferase [Candidatus Nanopelagicaceae bacterium]
MPLSKSLLGSRSGRSLNQQLKRSVKSLLYPAYERRLLRQLADVDSPKHVGVILDGNRRWARSAGGTSAEGHRAGARKIMDLLGWCESARIKHVTLWLLSTDNLDRPPSELEPLLEIIKETVSALADVKKWRIHAFGALDLLPADLVAMLRHAEESTKDVVGLEVNVAVGYGGRREISDAVRSLLKENAAEGRSIAEITELLTPEQIAQHLYSAGQPDPDLVIRTSGEQRLSGFLLWQSAHSEFYFCEAYWPDFRRVDFLRALRSYGERHRRFGS